MLQMRIRFSLFVLILEVRTNGRLLERQIELDRIARISAPMDSPYVPVILAKMIGDREDQSPTRRGFVEQIGLTIEEADRYTRYLRGQWQAFQADFHAEVGEKLDIAVRVA